MASKPVWVSSLGIRTKEEEDDPNESWILSPVRSPKSAKEIADIYGISSPRKSVPDQEPIKMSSVFSIFRRGKKRVAGRGNENNKSRSKSSNREEFGQSRIPTTPEKSDRKFSVSNQDEDRPNICSPLARFVDFSGEAHVLPSLSQLIAEETGFRLTEQAKIGGTSKLPLGHHQTVSISSRSESISDSNHQPFMFSLDLFPMSPRETAPARADFSVPVPLKL
mmetsp:Transcript_32081/g.37711  ORF Transcript_32081/g.37711 Transcript_32081/m.37711 type:complete len:222 (+) Transcript_32081:65-730(+)